jgi:hypothetical protein
LIILADVAEVALKTVIDAFGMYAIEASLLGNLTTVFNPEVVVNLDDVTITKIASESAESIVEREELEKQLSTLEYSLKTFQRMEIRQVSGMLLFSFLIPRGAIAMALD